MKSPSSHCYSVDHHSVYSYSEPAMGSVMTVYLQPIDDGNQQLFSFEIDIDPAAMPIPCHDSFGNRYHLFNIHRNHMSTTVHSRSVVKTSDCTILSEPPEQGTWKRLRELGNDIQFWNFLTNGKFTQPSPALADFARKHGLSPMQSPLETLKTACHTLHEQFAYTPNSTTVDSSIEHILETGKGVCQDYSHVMIALARSWGIPSRYVSGYLFLEGMPGEQSPQGASHAWCECWIPGTGWIGFDPTNNTIVDHRHIRLAQGRDYSDVAPTRGVLLGGGDAELEISVTIKADDQNSGASGSPDKSQQQGRNQSSTDLSQIGFFEPRHQAASQQQ